MGGAGEGDGAGSVFAEGLRTHTRELAFGPVRESSGKVIKTRLPGRGPGRVQASADTALLSPARRLSRSRSRLDRHFVHQARHRLPPHPQGPKGRRPSRPSGAQAQPQRMLGGPRRKVRLGGRFQHLCPGPHRGTGQCWGDLVWGATTREGGVSSGSSLVHAPGCRTLPCPGSPSSRTAPLSPPAIPSPLSSRTGDAHVPASGCPWSLDVRSLPGD